MTWAGLVALSSPALASPASVQKQAPTRATRFYGGIEGLLELFPAGVAGAGNDFLLGTAAAVGYDGGELFGVELGAPLRLRVIDGAGGAGGGRGGLFRLEDWDELSDVGQVLRLLRVGRAGDVFSLLAGPLDTVSLGRGHLVGRYSNRDNPNYRPAGVRVEGGLGAVRLEGLASDVLGARLFAAESTLDLGRLINIEPMTFDRYHVALSFAHDAGKAGGWSPPISVANLDVDMALWLSSEVRAFAFAGMGGRLFTAEGGFGAQGGVSVEGQVGKLEGGAKLELRKQGRGYRQGMFGPQYELSRFSAFGLGGDRLALELLPESFSGHAEVQLAGGASAVSGGSGWHASASYEQYSFGMAQLDATVSAVLPNLKGASGRLRVALLGLGRAPRPHLEASVRMRLWPSLYAIVTGGTAFVPLPDATLMRGYFAGVGVGSDFEL